MNGGGISWGLTDTSSSACNKIKGEKVQNTGEPKEDDFNLNLKMNHHMVRHFKGVDRCRGFRRCGQQELNKSKTGHN